ncbi:MAG: hypothetical protein JNJ54_03850 [Myxococcaceae bacterium]|nr:hypothetical protein [Myxococcaceae bacterium]
MALLVFAVLTTGCGRLNNGAYDKLTMNVRGAVFAQNPSRLSVTRHDPSTAVGTYRARSLSCRPGCEAEALQGTGPTAEFLVTFNAPGPFVLEAVVQRVEDQVLFADEFELEVIEAGPPKLELVLNSVAQPVSTISLVRDGSALVCASTVFNNTTISATLHDDDVQFVVEAPQVLSVKPEQQSVQRACRRVFGKTHGSSRIDATLGGKTTAVQVSVVEPQRLTGFSLVELSGVTVSARLVGPAREPIAAGTSSRLSVFKLEATTDDGRTVSIEPRCLTVKDGELFPARPTWNAEPIVVEAFTFSARTASVLEWNTRVCGQVGVPFSVRVVP